MLINVEGKDCGQSIGIYVTKQIKMCSSSMTKLQMNTVTEKSSYSHT